MRRDGAGYYEWVEMGWNGAVVWQWCMGWYGVVWYGMGWYGMEWSVCGGRAVAVAGVVVVVTVRVVAFTGVRVGLGIGMGLRFGLGLRIWIRRGLGLGCQLFIPSRLARLLLLLTGCAHRVRWV